jgi:phosphate transport system substrate-binding protein
MIQPWVSEFEAKRPEVRIVLYGSTHGDGLKCLLDGSADVAMVVKELSNQERQEAASRGLNLVEDKICNDALAIIVHKENPVAELSLDQLRAVFGGSYSNWNQVGGPNQPIEVITLPPDSGMASFLSKDVLKVPFAPHAILERAAREVVPLVQRKEGAISFCRTDLALKGSMSGLIKSLAIKKDDASAAVPLNKETIASGTFPIMRPVGLCYDSAKAPSAAKELGEFCRMKLKETSK